MDVSRLAPWYRWIEYAVFGRALESARFALLHRLQGRRRVLVLGEGDGRALKRMLAIAPSAEFDVVESSEAMIVLARQRIGDSSRVRFLHGDVRTVRLPQTRYDAVVSCFFLDCFTDEELPRLIEQVAAAIVPGGVWLNTEFTIPAKPFARLHATAWIWTMYRFFNIATGLRPRALPRIEETLARQGMRRQAIQRRRWGLIISEAWHLPERRSDLPRTGHLLWGEGLDLLGKGFPYASHR